MEKTTKEIWRDVVGYEGSYKVSNKGSVRSLDRIVTYSNGVNRLHKGKFLKLQSDKDGYIVVELNNSIKPKLKKVHRLVAESFLDNSKDKEFVNHKDGVKTNNFIDNLEWCTAKENCIHARKKGLINTKKGLKSPFSKLSEHQVKEIRNSLKSQYDLAKEFNVSQATINRVITRKRYKDVI